MGYFKEDLVHIKGFAFDVDGVLSKSIQTLDENGTPMRTTNIKDGYAIVQAVKMGYPVAIITGGRSEAVRKRFEALGVQDIFIGANDKVAALDQWMSKHELTNQQVLFIGDDIPDYDVMKRVGLPVCPKDAAPEIKAISRHISNYLGGEGIVRDMIEQVLKVQEKWVISKDTPWSSF
ncbi:HAD hydrolase family protein [Halosquirtibacter xylanolyticus]|uniref:KdsC family phosphatase n=1 Tax=Halosquirtibacter xylanolyticus TaxID=3374599 RepID=UPI0037479778|nr:HAD hydrolase family protein [Prolixibacteraceae bacterium]